MIPELESHAAWYEGPNQNGKDDTANAIRDTIKKIQAFDDTPDFKLISIAEDIKDEH